jgi:uncharacterized RDD family membrane protein YckC
MKSAEMLAIAPATVFLVVSFFVLLATRKLEAGSLKAFGKVIIALLWICAVLAVLTGIGFISKCDRFPGKMMMKGKMPHHMMKKDMMQNEMMHKGMMQQGMMQNETMMR